MRWINSSLSERKISIIEFGLIFVTAVIPLFFNHPYRINLFLAWEGAFRLSNGEIPYRDFGSPVGYGFWILPALFFKIFGPYVYTLLITQSFINISSGLIFRQLLKLFQLSPGARLLTLIVYCLSYSMFNFWPWYNHLVFVIELAGLCLLCAQVLKVPQERNPLILVASAFLIAFSFLTKQDTGALGLMIALVILAFDFVFEKQFKSAIYFVIAYIISLALLIGPFIPYEFTYWFNMGQFPHYARVDKFDIVNEFLGASDYIKFYLMLFVIFMALHFSSSRGELREHKTFLLFALVVLCILGQATVIQVTSYTPIDGNIYFHSVAFAFILHAVARNIDLQRVTILAGLSVFVFLWWSGVFWTRFLKDKVKPLLVNKDVGGHVISKRTYLLSGDTLKSNRSQWVVPRVASFKRIKIPADTERGILALMEMPEVKKQGSKILNMSELTPLAYDLGYELEKAKDYPLWFHKGVSFFDREVKDFCQRVTNKEYDVILFEDIPNVNQFYPYEVRDCIRETYTYKYKFLAPRIPEISYIEVYVKE